MIRLVRDRLGLGIGSEMANYLAAISAGSSAPIEIIAHDARTGIPVRKTIDPKSLATEPGGRRAVLRESAEPEAQHIPELRP